MTMNDYQENFNDDDYTFQTIQTMNFIAIIFASHFHEDFFMMMIIVKIMMMVMMMITVMTMITVV